MIKLINAELYKIIKKRSFIILFIFIISFSIIYMYLNNNKVDKSIKSIIISEKMTDKEYYSYNKKGNYNVYLDNYKQYVNNVNSINKYTSNYNESKLRNLISSSYSLYVILGFIILYFAYSIYSYDYQSGTLRYVYLSGYSRFKILLSRIITLLLLTFTLYLLVSIIILISSYLLTNESIFKINDILLFNKVYNIKLIYIFIIKTILFMFTSLIISILSIFICNLLKGSNGGLIIMFLIYFLSSSVSFLLVQNNISLVSYTFLPYLDLTYFEDINNVLLNNLVFNINYSYCNLLKVYIVYFILLLILNSLLIKRDI